VDCDDDSVDCDDDSPPCFAPVDNLDAILGETGNMSNESLINYVLGEKGEREYFSNGFGYERLSANQKSLRGVVETKKRKASFLLEWSGSAAILRALPFLW